MIKLLEEGTYKLIETINQTKILILNNERTFAWINATGIGEILVSSHNVHKTDCILSIGKYRIYAVKDEKQLTDLTHLELNVGEGKWQGYLLLSGLPTKSNIRNRIIPTKEVITKTTLDSY